MEAHPRAYRETDGRGPRGALTVVAAMGTKLQARVWRLVERYVASTRTRASVASANHAMQSACAAPRVPEPGQSGAVLSAVLSAVLTLRETGVGMQRQRPRRV